MKKITRISGKTIPLAMNDVDTDLIIPAQYLTSITREGYGKNLFIRLRQGNPDFVFNQPQFAGANILITQENFGCGSSREHAVWSLQEAGIQAVIATSFADIFFGNSAKNGLLLITQPPEVINKFLDLAKSGNFILTIDVESQIITTNLGEALQFALDPFLQYCFIHGLDDMDYLLAHKEKIVAYKNQQR
jgi:3-isopropylmalate/(R)-2-methylmalate dehydratase small subunit